MLDKKAGVRVSFLAWIDINVYMRHFSPQFIPKILPKAQNA
jgi:hypothetical protein